MPGGCARSWWKSLDAEVAIESLVPMVGAGCMAALQLGTDLVSCVIEAELVIAFTPYFFRANPCQFLGLWQLTFLIKFRWAALRFMNPSNHKGTVKIAIKEINHYNFTNAW